MQMLVKIRKNLIFPSFLITVGLVSNMVIDREGQQMQKKYLFRDWRCLLKELRTCDVRSCRWVHGCSVCPFLSLFSLCLILTTFHLFHFEILYRSLKVAFKIIFKSHNNYFLSYTTIVFKSHINISGSLFHSEHPVGMDLEVINK